VNRLLAFVAFIGCVVSANVLTAHLGLVPLAFGLMVTAGTFTAGLALLVRDWLDDAGGRRWVLAAIVAGAGLSWAMTPGWRLALASGLAFVLSESADWAVYGPLRDRGWARAAMASNVVGAVVDSLLFLAVAGFPLWPGVPVQAAVKVAVTGLFVALAVVARAVLRDRLRPEGA
jgi:queuosine precursor transporter